MLQNITEVSPAVVGADAAGPSGADGLPHAWRPSSVPQQYP